MTFELDPPEKTADMLLHHLGAAASILVARAVDRRHLDQMLEAASGHLYEMAAEQDGPSERQKAEG